MKYKAIIFDMDGTIIHTESVWKDATRTLIERRGHILSNELEIELNNLLCGLALSESCKLIKDRMQLPDSLEALIQEKSDLAQLFYQQQVQFIDGFLSFHAKVISLNLKVAVATNANDATLISTKKRLPLEKLFGEHLYNISHVSNQGKPNPALYLHAAKQLNCPPEECIAIEDSAHGIKAAVSAGLFCIGINTSKNANQIKESHHQIDHYDEIDLESLLNIPKIKKVDL